MNNNIIIIIILYHDNLRHNTAKLLPWVDWAAWHLPGGPVGLPSRWARCWSRSNNLPR